MRPRCPRFVAASARYRRHAGRAAPLPHAPGALPGRPTTCAGRGATADPSAGAGPVRTPGRCSPSTCSGSVSRGGTTSGAAAASRPATWRVLMPAACSISSRWRCGCSSGAADNGPGDSSANGSSRNDSGAREAVCRDSDGATTGTGTGTDADAGRSVGGRSCGARPSSDDGAAGPGTGSGSGSQEGAGNGEAFPFNSGRGSSAPACVAPRSCATAWLATGTTGAFTAAASPEHSPAGGASSGADQGPRSPRSPASPGAAGSPSCLVRPAES